MCGGGCQSTISPVSTNFDSTAEKISQNLQLVIKYEPRDKHVQLLPFIRPRGRSPATTSAAGVKPSGRLGAWELRPFRYVAIQGQTGAPGLPTAAQFHLHLWSNVHTPRIYWAHHTTSLESEWQRFIWPKPHYNSACVCVCSDSSPMNQQFPEAVLYLPVPLQTSLYGVC